MHPCEGNTTTPSPSPSLAASGCSSAAGCVNGGIPLERNLKGGDSDVTPLIIMRYSWWRSSARESERKRQKEREKEKEKRVHICECTLLITLLCSLSVCTIHFIRPRRCSGAAAVRRLARSPPFPLPRSPALLRPGRPSSRSFSILTPPLLSPSYAPRLPVPFAHRHVATDVVVRACPRAVYAAGEACARIRARARAHRYAPVDRHRTTIEREREGFWMDLERSEICPGDGMGRYRFRTVGMSPMTSTGRCTSSITTRGRLRGSIHEIGT